MLMTVHLRPIPCTLFRHLQTVLQNSASRFGLTINIQKIEVMFQPAPGKAYSNPQVNINGVSLKPVSQFCYLGSTLSNDALLDKEITNRISKASSSYGMLSDRV